MWREASCAIVYFYFADRDRIILTKYRVMMVKYHP